jgi:hypothetical protein
MKRLVCVRIGVLLLAIGAWAACLSARLWAFDTGHHHDLTGSAMKSLGFNANSIKTAQLENWLVDYYSSQPLAGLEDDLKKLHFDNLEDTARVAIYWKRFKVNSKAAFEKAAADGDSVRVVALLGMSLHAVQDFYTHSDWVEQHPIPASGFLTDSYFDNAILASGSIRTGHYPNHLPLRSTDHGGGAAAAAGMNHDAYSRARWDRAYVHAFCASRQWIEAVRTWVVSVPGGATVWTDALNLNLAAGDLTNLDRDLGSAYRISEYAPGGHWKGPGSDSSFDFGKAVAKFASSGDSIFVKHLKDHKWHKQLTDGLELTAAPDTDPTIPSITHPFVAVQVRTLHVEELPVGVLESKIDVRGKADFYAIVTIDGQQFTESMQLDGASISPAWRSIAFVPASQSSVSIRYELWEEDGGLAGKDNRCDIFEARGESALAMTFALTDDTLSGDINGVHNTEATAFESGGKLPDKDRAKVNVVISKAALNP